MKKPNFFIAIACGIVAMTLGSCTKDRICTCTDSDGDSWKQTLVGVTKGQAKANCVSTTETDGGDTYTVTCKLD